MQESFREGNNITAWKNEGELLSELVERIRNEFDIQKDSPITYAGRLDPMAEGVMLLLVGEAVHEKDIYLKLPKTYEVEMLFGISSDTSDALGIVSGHETVPSAETASETIRTFPKTYAQRYPNYSSKPVNGKPLFQHAREGTEIKAPTHEVTIHEVEIKNSREETGSEIADRAIQRIQKVNGDFRQSECIASWKQFQKDFAEKKFLIVETTITAEGGTYMRMLAQDIAEKMQTGAIAWKIVRTKIGN